MALQRAERKVPCCGVTSRVHVRGHFLSAHGCQGVQSRYGVVFVTRSRVATNSQQFRGLACAVELRRPRSTDLVPEGLECLRSKRMRLLCAELQMNDRVGRQSGLRQTARGAT